MKHLITVMIMILSTISIANAQTDEQKALIAEFEEGKRGPSSTSDLEKILEMDSLTKDVFSQGKRDFINKEIKGISKGVICGAAVADHYDDFTGAVDRAKSKSKNKDPEFQDLSYVEIAFYLSCGDELTPFFKNINPNFIRFDDNGLTHNTLSMIQEMGPLLTMKGPDGRTVKQYVDDLVRFASATKNSTLIGVYRRIQASIDIILMKYDEQYAGLKEIKEKRDSIKMCERNQ